MLIAHPYSFCINFITHSVYANIIVYKNFVLIFCIYNFYNNMNDITR